MRKNHKINAVATASCAILIWSAGGCASALPSSRLSSIDAGYEFSRLQQTTVFGATKSSTKSPGVSFYQRVLSKTLGSRCSLYPSDSVYAQINTQRCGSAFSTLRSMSRFYFEPDAPTMGTPVIERDQRILFKDLPNDCRFF
jgi:hypothetical protein